MYEVSYNSFYIKALPHPYSNKDYSPPNMTYCWRKCTNRKLIKQNLTRVHIGKQLFKSKLASNSQRNDSIFNAFISKIDHECDEKYKYFEVKSKDIGYYAVS